MAYFDMKKFDEMIDYYKLDDNSRVAKLIGIKGYLYWNGEWVYKPGLSVLRYDSDNWELITEEEAMELIQKFDEERESENKNTKKQKTNKKA